MVDIVVSVAAKVAEYLVAPVGRHCGYVIFTNSYVGQLKEELEKLDEVKVGVQRSVNDAENNMMEIRLEVNRWKNDAENSASKARGVLNNDGRATNKTCFCGWLPKPKERYFLGRDARKTAQAIQALIPQGKFERVYYERAAPGHVPGASDVNLSAGDGGHTITDSRASIFRDIMKALDDEKQKVIGVYGPGGVGKTTLLEEVEKKLKKEGRPFHMIVKAKVSQTPDLNKIQDDIAYFFGLKLDEPSEEGRRDLLCRRLQNDPSEKILIILDDLWDKLDLKAVGIPFGEESRGCKLLLTSRFSDVLEQKMLADLTFRLEGLNDGEAFKLFEQTVGDKLKDEELRRIAPEIVKKLAGLPLLIISVASTLKYSHVSAWKKALRKIDESNIETIVKLSYDHLNSEDAKSLFLLCGLIGGTIQVETLFVLGMGLGLFERFNETMQDSRDDLNIALDSLRSICLLQDGGDDKEKVTIHDLYSEVVVSTPFRDQNSLMMNSNYGFWSKEKLEKCWAICVTDVDKKRPDQLMKSQFPDLKILMLSQPEGWYWRQEHEPEVGDCSRLPDFKDMKELCALYFCSMYIVRLPPSIEILGNLRSLYLYNCNAKDVAIIGKLKALQILSFATSAIYRLPEEMGELTNLRLLNLSDCTKLQQIKPTVLKRLIKLEELHMKGSFDRWMAKNEKPLELCNAGLAELRSMTKLNSLEISIPDPITLSEVDDLPFENLTRFWIKIGNVYGREFKGLRTMKIKLEGHDSILSKKWVQKTLQKTQYLLLDGLGKFENVHELCIRGFPQLKHLDIKDSPSVKYIANSSNSAFTILESLILNDLINLEKICHGHIAAECFSKLKAVKVLKCNRLEYLWSLSQMQNLVQLEEIHVWHCNSMRAIARKDTLPADCRAELPCLRHLDLVDLPNMTSFCLRAEMTSESTPIQVRVVGEGGGDEGTELVTTTSDLQNTYSDSFFDRKASLPNLEELKLASVGSFKRIWHNELSISSFCKLAIITIKNCSNLLHIFPSTIIGRLHNLKSVEVKNCPSMKLLFDFGSLDSNTEQNAVLLPELVRIDVESCPSLESLFNCGSLDSNVEHKIILLPKLKEVRVSGANKLKHVVMSQSQIVLGFPSLEIVQVENCSDLRYLFPKYTATTLMKLKWLKISKCEHIKEVILEKEASRSEAKVMSFPCLSTLTLKKLDNLISFGSGSVKRQLGKIAKENDESPQPLFNEMVTFPNMRYLEIEGIPCKELWNNHIPANSIVCSHRFLSKNVKVKNCPSLKWLFGFRSLDSNTEQNAVLLPELVSINVESCASLESLFNCGSPDSNTEHKNILLPKLEEVSVSGAKKLRHVVMSHSQIVMSFPCLSTLTLKELDNLNSFGSGSVKRQLGEIAKENDESPQPLFNEMITFPNMRYLEIEGVPCKELWNNHVPADSTVCSHRFLSKNVKVKNCPSLKWLFGFRSLDSNTEQNAVLLPELVSINVESCASLESLFNCGSPDSNTEHKNILLPKLEEVSVSGAKKLRHVVMSHSQIVMSFPCLRTLTLKELDNLNSFGSGSVKRQLGEIAKENDESPQPLFNEMVTFPNMRYLEIEGVPCKELWNNHVPTDSTVCSHQFLSKNVKVKNCPSLKWLFDFGSLDSNTEQNTILLPELVRINVESCASLESLFNCGFPDSNAEHKIILLPKLKGVSVSGAKKLRYVVMSHSQIVLGFPSLKIVDVENCPDLRYLFPKYTATTLMKLKWLRISECKQIKEVILEKEGGRSEPKVMSFPCLSELALEELNNFEAFISSPTSVKRQLGETAKENDESPQPLFNEMVTFPNITLLEINGLRCKELWNNQIPTDSFQKLENLKLKNNDNLQHIATSHMWKKLQRCLEKLKVISCHSIDIIYEGDGMDIESSKLWKLVLRDLENLRCIWKSDSLPNIPFPNLIYVEVERCPRLEMLFPTFTAKFLGQIEEVIVGSCEDMELIAGHEKGEGATHTTITFSKLNFLVLEELPKFKRFFLDEKYSLKFQCFEDFPSLLNLRIESCGAEPDQYIHR